MEHIGFASSYTSTYSVCTLDSIHGFLYDKESKNKWFSLLSWYHMINFLKTILKKNVSSLKVCLLSIEKFRCEKMLMSWFVNCQLSFSCKFAPHGAVVITTLKGVKHAAKYLLYVKYI